MASPAAALSLLIPEVIRVSLSEARQCLACRTYTASVAMAGRALEALCRHFHTKGKPDKLMLAEGLRELLDSKIVDHRLYEWAEELRHHRNLAAHGSGAVFSRDDAQDILDFAVTICDYVFVLNHRFEQFRKRINRPARKKSGLKR